MLSLLGLDQVSSRNSRRGKFVQAWNSRRLWHEALEQRAMLAVSIAATNVDSLFTDVDGDGVADPGDTLQYAVTITTVAAQARRV